MEFGSGKGREDKEKEKSGILNLRIRRVNPKNGERQRGRQSRTALSTRILPKKAAGASTRNLTSYCALTG